MKFKGWKQFFVLFLYKLTSYRQVAKIVVVAHSLKKVLKFSSQEKNYKLISQQMKNFLFIARVKKNL